MQASAEQTLQALVNCAKCYTNDTTQGQMQALHGLLDIHKEAVSCAGGGQHV
jgi:hypothetical protein